MLYMAGFFHSRILLPEAFVNDESVKREMKDAEKWMQSCSGDGKADEKRNIKPSLREFSS